MNLNSYGGYTTENVEIFEAEDKFSYVVEKIDELSFTKFIELAIVKAKRQFGVADTFWVTSQFGETIQIFGLHITSNLVRKSIEIINYYSYLILFFFMILGLYYCLKTNSKNYSLIFVNVIAINLIVYTFVEISSRYSYLFQISMFILSALGIDYVFKSLEDRRLQADDS